MFPDESGLASLKLHIHLNITRFSSIDLSITFHIYWPGVTVSASHTTDVFYLLTVMKNPSMLQHCWLGDKKGIQSVKSWLLVC